MHPDSVDMLSPEDLEQMPGYSRNHEANLREAKRLLAEAGYPNGFKTWCRPTATSRCHTSI